MTPGGPQPSTNEDIPTLFGAEPAEIRKCFPLQITRQTAWQTLDALEWNCTPPRALDAAIRVTAPSLQLGRLAVGEARQSLPMRSRSLVQPLANGVATTVQLYSYPASTSTAVARDR